MPLPTQAVRMRPPPRSRLRPRRSPRRSHPKASAPSTSASPGVEAIDRQQELDVDYQNAEAPAPTARIVAPMDLGYFNHRWVVFVHDVVRGKLKTYRLDRIHGVKTTGRTCARPTDYNLDEIIGGNLGAYTGTERHEIRVRLTGFAAADARSKKWHRTQTEVDRGAAGLEITLQLNNLVDITSQILSWGPLAEALAPPELRTRVREQLKATMAKYEG